MQKSTSKTVLVLKTKDSRCFEEAHLILKDNYEAKPPSGSLLAEANRIILQAGAMGERCGEKTSAKAEEDRRLRWFAAGVLTGLGACFLGAFLLSLLI